MFTVVDSPHVIECQIWKYYREGKRKQNLQESEKLIGNRYCVLRHEFKRVFSFDGDNILFLYHEGYYYTYYSENCL